MSSSTKKKPRGRPFTGTNDPRRSTSGQRNKAAVAFNKEIRSIIAEVGNEELAKDGKQYSRIELAVRGLYIKAAKGDVSAFNALVERVEGKVTQPIGGDEKSPLKIIIKYADSHPDTPETS